MLFLYKNVKTITLIAVVKRCYTKKVKKKEIWLIYSFLGFKNRANSL